MATKIKNQQFSKKNLDIKLRQLAQDQNARPQGGLPSDTENLKQVMNLIEKLYRPQ